MPEHTSGTITYGRITWILLLAEFCVLPVTHKPLPNTSDQVLTSHSPLPLPTNPPHLPHLPHLLLLTTHQEAAAWVTLPVVAIYLAGRARMHTTLSSE